ncbi:unnamed protein product, partial [Ectocarpus fasciculatus]
PELRKGVAKGRRSRSHSRTRYADEDDGASSAASGAGGGLTAKRKQPRGGVLGSKLLRRSQTTGDMDATRQGGASSGGERVPVAKRNRRDASVQRREASIESRGSGRGPRNMNDSRGRGGRDNSTDSRSSFFSYSSSRSGAGGAERGGRGHRRKRSSGGSGSSSVLSVSSHESSRSRGNDRRRVSRFDRWRDKLAAGESAREKVKAGEHHRHHHRDDSRKQEHAAAAASSSGKGSSREVAAHGHNNGQGRGKSAGTRAPRGPPGAEADALTLSELLSVDPAAGGVGGVDAGVRRGSDGRA